MLDRRRCRMFGSRFARRGRMRRRRTRRSRIYLCRTCRGSLNWTRDRMLDRRRCRMFGNRFAHRGRMRRRRGAARSHDTSAGRAGAASTGCATACSADGGASMCGNRFAHRGRMRIRRARRSCLYLRRTRRSGLNWTSDRVLRRRRSPDAGQAPPRRRLDAEQHPGRSLVPRGRQTVRGQCPDR